MLDGEQPLYFESIERLNNILQWFLVKGKHKDASFYNVDEDRESPKLLVTVKLPYLLLGTYIELTLFLLSHHRYGPGYLSHAQSWRYNFQMGDSYAKYESGSSWNRCPDAHSHACLERYPVDGNMIFHQEAFEAWRVEETKRGKY